ncbi:MAG: zinc ABC transporter substrate-binding protein [Alphaproteobacteria bacterium]|nr:zinc ABC transporter substrate-binding protein [Alphaproteobacteria bacterium]
MRLLSLLVAALLLVATRPVWPVPPIPMVAAENFYGDIAEQIGGPEVEVTSILSNPDQDPHLFEVSPSVARALSGARIVVYNGIDYDPWMAKLLGAVASRDRQIVVAADLVGRKPGDNPHIWYDPKTMPAVAAALADALQRADPSHAADYRGRLERFRRSLAPIDAKIAALRERLQGTPVTATEPVFGYMFSVLGMQVRNAHFQLAVMNNTEPSAADVAAFENDLKTHKVRLLVYNSQASDPVAARMVKLAHAAQIAVVGAGETEPPGKSYQAWMMSELEAVDRALPH